MDRDVRKAELLAQWERVGTLNPEEYTELEELIDPETPEDRALLRMVERDLRPEAAGAPARPADPAAQLRDAEGAADVGTDADASARVDAVMDRIYQDEAERIAGSVGAGDQAGSDHASRDQAGARWSRWERALVSVGAAAAGVALLIGAAVFAVTALSGEPGESPAVAADGRTVESLAGADDAAAADQAAANASTDRAASGAAMNGGTVVVRFELVAPEAGSVSLVGDFNEWNEGTHELRDADNDGVWEIEVPLERGEVYTYNFLINGDEWIPDPSAVNHIEDSFGGEKSVLNL